jgi:hypothetical protein
MVENALAMKMDPTVDVAPTREFNSVAAYTDDVQAGLANNINSAPNASMSFQAAVTFEVSQPEIVQDVTVIYNQDLLTGVENACMLPEIQPDMSANDSLFGAFCTITEEFSKDIAELSTAVGMGKQASLGPVQVEPQETMQQTWTPPSPGMNGMA